MSTETAENVIAADNSLTDLFIKAVAGRAEIITDEAVLTERGHDFWGVGGTAGLLVRPASRDEIAEIMRVATEHHVADRAESGGASNCSAGMMPAAGRVLLDLSGLNQILEVDVENRCARVEPGVINSDLQAALAPHGLCFSPDPVSAHLATVGRQHHRKRRRPTRIEVRRDLQPHPVRGRRAARRVDHHLQRRR